MLRRDPYRLFFPLGLGLAAAGVVPWLLFARGLSFTWPGLSHALVMSQGFFVAIAIGFLGTMGPRKTGTEPLSAALIAVLAVTVVLSAAAALAGATAVAEGLHVAALATIAVAAAGRARRGTLPPSFVLVPLGAALAVAGAVLLVAAPDLRLARALAAQGLMLCLVPAVAPILVPAILGVAPRAGARSWLVGLGIVAGFVVEEWLSTRAGLWLRGGAVAYALVAAGALEPSTKTGVHRALFRVALLLVPLGLVAAGLAPERRVALLHITYAGGFAGLILAVSVHVTLFHGGRAALADGWPALVVVAAACLAGTVALRTLLEGFGARYLDAMTAAAALWLVAVVAWAAFLIPLSRRTHARGP